MSTCLRVPLYCSSLPEQTANFYSLCGQPNRVRPRSLVDIARSAFFFFFFFLSANSGLPWLFYFMVHVCKPVHHHYTYIALKLVPKPWPHQAFHCLHYCKQWKLGEGLGTGLEILKISNNTQATGSNEHPHHSQTSVGKSANSQHINVLHQTLWPSSKAKNSQVTGCILLRVRFTFV